LFCTLLNQLTILFSFILSIKDLYLSFIITRRAAATQGFQLQTPRVQGLVLQYSFCRPHVWVQRAAGLTRLRERNPTSAKTLCLRDRLVELIAVWKGLAPTQRYHKKQCMTEVFPRTWLEGRRLDFRLTILLICSWCKDYVGSQSCSKELDITEVTSANTVLLQIL
ncbi:hypothetical protein M514_00840, partial [Trichuris suis]